VFFESPQAAIRTINIAATSRGGDNNRRIGALDPNQKYKAGL
jgi:hypothetical protein